MQLSAAYAAVVATIVRASEAWSRLEDVVGVHGAETVAEMVNAGWLDLWERPDYPAVTLTPWGAWRAGVVVEEVWRPAVETREERDEGRPLAFPRLAAETVLVETPVWDERTERDEAGDPVRPDRPVVLPRHARIGQTLAAPERIPAPPESGPDVLRDEEGEPVRLFPAFGGGVVVVVDRRVRGKR